MASPGVAGMLYSRAILKMYGSVRYYQSRQQLACSKHNHPSFGHSMPEPQRLRRKSLHLRYIAPVSHHFFTGGDDEITS